MKKQTKVILILAIIILVVVAFLYPRLDTRNTNENAVTSTGSGSGPAQELPVNVVKLKKESLRNQLQVTGTILPNESVDIRPEVSGLVSKISFKEGQYVTKGTPLVYLDDDELQAQYQRLQYTQKLFETQENRQKQLLAREAISQEEYDIALNQYNTTLSDLKLVEAQLAKRIIRAPFSGRIGLRMISEGSVISPSDMIASIVNIDPIKIEFSIPERYSNQVKMGAPIYFSNESSKEEVQGEVYAYEPQIDAATRTLKLRALSSNKEGKFLPGMYVRIRFVLEVTENALMVPAESIIPELQGYKVYVVGPDNKAQEKTVEIGTRTETQVQILSGLEEGDLVLATGVLQARPGMPLKYTQIN
ncbi:MAG TPA: efflux transporter periplasmic adaptor subunit [Algoriphagus sp.]|jgi:membrane fusion protein (multidrug efflux system)|uniref:efflux RND transporter periplasmic adaptor subunit n=1 Tax=unclassified Algoriphagus TaxID=2641541 RepID=UPI000C3E48C0|nr:MULTISPECIES: efflux RND transporter periplasmic adaptor subunit [unclassified Algoriphagus]MAL13515.1 efflux transporter periplasmic adaptor subunit [Algoriphagus sp.]MAN88689.1 efflux transporter periplasmic adaptor subunit [Algoriphagus sp.]HAS59401.1 efflux transporter periplasmic adaptor subunit [Algoriphagus sp.]HCD89682.1 efflux transporter periplasmic adaptor subunit [Algoriphagus sp.]HCH44521.1 efflux transporter periplasmic adaptor subunit [Algoriphagus sp.]|tara:strand:+ start:971 stop:2053 length:1083 start_codon:yes stop_codon:yes gene_type:complete